MVQKWITSLFLLFLFLSFYDLHASENHSLSARPRIDWTDASSIRQHQPVLIAHRGGVVTPNSPENSLAAVRLAAQRGYSMVEVDVRESTDHVPVCFHDNTLLEDCGIDSKIEELSSEKITATHFTNSPETIATLKDYLALCNELNLGIMLDIKTYGSDDYFKTITELIQCNHLDKSTVTIANPAKLSEKTKAEFAGTILLPLNEEEMSEIQEGTDKSYPGKIWFNWPRYITNEQVKLYQDHGVRVMPSINIFHYPKEQYMELAKRDIERMKEAGVDAYQIDGEFDSFFQIPASP